MPNNTKEFKEASFQKEVIDSTQPVLVDFWAEWCGPCKMLTPTIDELADEYANKAVIGKLNVDENPSIASEYGIRSIPSLLFFNNGLVMDQRVGAISYKEIANILDKHSY